MSALKKAGWAALGVVLASALVVGGVVLWSSYQKVPLPIEDRCSATVKGRTTTVDPDQAYYAAIIAGMSVQRELKPRAASIALATAYQESGIRNLDYGHSDSLGLFQQRPSKGWGTEAEIMDPWYSSREFYRALVKVRKWDSKDINDVAQAVQRSAYPDAYRKHVDNAKTLASSLTGETPASFTCVFNKPAPANPTGLAEYLTKTLKSQIDVTVATDSVRITAKGEGQAWAAAEMAVAASGRFGVSAVQVGPYGWKLESTFPASWSGTGPVTSPEVVVSFPTASATPR
ncbi:hypothetical protein ATK74_1878 [Propionicimonas paludicola]|uniref:Uncharacterized protein n=1 Tax=Propionicimonas paludicola TaxID=185243 RepID=A0A2A9CT14_9ACTN|nr:hypothetical protein [Propionicimonas paludicola]PFG17311.1 hypothetical protein ATK74_1878 [Propionicimonas paludicola]